MQNAKDTFYEVLRGRLAALNPERTVVVRGVTRPGVLVVENELLSASVPVDCFALRWSGVTCDGRGALPTITMTCEISYATAATVVNAGMDRGRVLASMDAELLMALLQEPRKAVKKNFAGGGTPVEMATRVWWGEAVFADAKAVGERMQRTVTVAVMSFEEAGEL